MTEMLASLMTRANMKQEIQEKLQTAYKTLIKEAYPSNQQFFLTKNSHRMDNTELTYQALKAMNTYNQLVDQSDIKGLIKHNQLKDYFMTKAQISDDLGQVVNSLKALDMIVAKN